MIDLERQIVGACLLDERGYWRIADLLTPDDFEQPDCRRMFDALADLGRQGVDLDAITIGERRPDLSALAMSLASEATGARGIRAWAEALVKRTEQRRFVRIRERIGRAETPDEAYSLLATCQPRNATSVKRVREYASQSVDQMQARATSEGVTVGLRSGLAPLDDMTNGWQPGDLIVLAARPSVGKTAIALQFAAHASASEKAPVLFFSQEQSGVSVADRLLSHVGHIPGESIRDPRKMAPEHWPRMTAATATLNEMPLWIDESTDLTVEAIAARARQLDAEHRLGLIVIDYLGLMRMPKADRHDLAVAAVTRGLKGLAKALRVPVILLCQLNREGVGRPTKKDLRDSGAIEQDADLIIFLYRKDDQNREHTTLILDKQRNGPCGDVDLHSNLSLMRFDPWIGPDPVMAPVSQRGFGRRVA